MTRTALPLLLPPLRSGSRLLSLAILLMTGLAACMPVQPARQPRPAPPPERLPVTDGLLGEEIRPVDRRMLGAVDYDLPVEANSWVEAELRFLVGQRRDVVHRWLERGDAYEGFVREVFREHGIPSDLYYLALIESGFIPGARSRAGAVGVWQFMPATSGDVGLRIDTVLDERMDPVRSTRAAARHLRSLYRIHGDWALAAAAYNAGSTRIRRGMEVYGANDFWDLAQRGNLAAETREYVPRLHAMTIIGRDRQRFGFQPQPEVPTFAFDSIHVDYSLSLQELAQLGNVDPAALSRLNPHLLQGITPANGYWVWVPQGRGVEMQRAYLASELRRERERPAARTVAIVPRPASDPPRDETPRRATTPALATVAAPSRETVHTVSAGETLSGIAQRYGVAVRDIQQANSLSGSTIVTGSRLRIPPAQGAARFAEHTVQRGETLSGIAERYGVPMAQIREANSLTGSTIVTGRRLRIPTSGESAGSAAVAEAPAAAPARPAAVAGGGGIEHTIQPGETLSGIAERYGVPMAQIREANSLTGSTIVTGRRLRIPTPGGSAGSAAAAVAETPAATPARPAAVAGGGGIEHTVQWGETLSGIAERYGVPMAQIREANSLTGSTIVTGRRLRIPTSGGSAGSAAVTVAEAPAASPARPAAVASGGGIEHTVQPGETLSGIAQRYEVPVARIQEENGLTGSTIVIGRRLRIPSRAPAAAAVPAEHVVQSGETLSGIARQHGVTVAGLQEANSLRGSVIVPGQRLRIPPSASGGETSPRVTEHIVLPGETLWGIAQRYGTSVALLQRVNGLGERPIVPGQRLTIPG